MRYYAASDVFLWKQDPQLLVTDSLSSQARSRISSKDLQSQKATRNAILARLVTTSRILVSTFPYLSTKEKRLRFRCFIFYHYITAEPAIRLNTRHNFIYLILLCAGLLLDDILAEPHFLEF